MYGIYLLSKNNYGETLDPYIKFLALPKDSWPSPQANHLFKKRSRHFGHQPHFSQNPH